MPRGDRATLQQLTAVVQYLRNRGFTLQDAQNLVGTSTTRTLQEVEQQITAFLKTLTR